MGGGMSADVTAIDAADGARVRCCAVPHEDGSTPWRKTLTLRVPQLPPLAALPAPLPAGCDNDASTELIDAARFRRGPACSAPSSVPSSPSNVSCSTSQFGGRRLRLPSSCLSSVPVTCLEARVDMCCGSGAPGGNTLTTGTPEMVVGASIKAEGVDVTTGSGRQVAEPAEATALASAARGNGIIGSARRPRTLPELISPDPGDNKDVRCPADAARGG
mmetsp:Transcript_20237/g.46703  ORF Transcript_20237/g.46703 Transcript_20237/m.46703 type:complete len:218 (-) Transcript_20237:1136-1789(-)